MTSFRTREDSPQEEDQWTSLYTTCARIQYRNTLDTFLESTGYPKTNRLLIKRLNGNLESIYTLTEYASYDY
jgi:hypothetical protein